MLSFVKLFNSSALHKIYQIVKIILKSMDCGLLRSIIMS